MQPHFLDQPILQRLVGALNASLGLAAVGTDKFNAQIAQRTPKLRGSAAARVRALTRNTACLSL